MQLGRIRVTFFCYKVHASMLAVFYKLEIYFVFTAPPSKMIASPSASGDVKREGKHLIWHGVDDVLGG